MITIDLMSVRFGISELCWRELAGHYRGAAQCQKECHTFWTNTQFTRVAPLTRQRRAPLNPVLEIIIGRSRRVTRCHHRLRSSQQTGDKFVVQNPKRGEVARCHGAFLGVLFYPLRENQRFLAKFGLTNSLIAATSERSFRPTRLRFVLTGQDAACQRRIRDNTHPVISASQQHLDFVAPIYCVLIWLADHGFRDAHPLAEAHNFGHSPGPIVGEPPGQHLILCDDVTHRGDRFRERRNEIFFMQMPNIDLVGLQAVEALIDASCHVTFPRRVSRDDGAG